MWEEVIIMLPEKINLIFLSATTPNTKEFCDWIGMISSSVDTIQYIIIDMIYQCVGKTKRRKVYIISTNNRPIPLQHFLYHDEEVYKVLSVETGYNQKAIASGIVSFLQCLSSNKLSVYQL